MNYLINLKIKLEKEEIELETLLYIFAILSFLPFDLVYNITDSLLKQGEVITQFFIDLKRDPPVKNLDVKTESFQIIGEIKKVGSTD